MAMSDRPLYREVNQLVAEALCAHGMRKRISGYFTRELEGDVRGSVALNEAKKYGFTINPIIGVRHELLERLLAQMAGREFNPYAPSTIATPIGYLMDPPEYRMEDL